MPGDELDQVKRKLNALQCSFAAFTRLVYRLSPENRSLLLDTLFLEVSGAIFHARVCAAGLACSTKLKRTHGRRGRLSALEEFFKTFSEGWLESLGSPHSR